MGGGGGGGGGGGRGAALIHLILQAKIGHDHLF